jgi:hypothetical protein
VVVQETGWSRHLPAGQGALSFRTPPEAAEAMDRVAKDYRSHAQNARRMAEEWFDARKVCADLLSRA